MNAYHGPIVCLTHQEAAAVLPAEPKTPAEISAAAKIKVALGSDPKWREALR